MELRLITDELLKAQQEFRAIKALIALMHSSGNAAHWRTSRCPACGASALLSLTFQYYPFRRGIPAQRISLSPIFEVLDGYCTSCGDDSLWQRLCRIDPTRDREQGTHTPQWKHGQMCPHCLGNAFQGIWRDGRVMGACNECRWLIATPDLTRRNRRILAEMSRARREQKQLVERLEEKHLMNLVQSLCADDEDDLPTIPPPPSSTG